MKNNMKNKVITGSYMTFMIVLDGILTNTALNKGGFYETNPFTNTFGIIAHTLLLVGLTYLFMDRWVKKDCLVSKSMIIIGSIVWTLNNAISAYLLYLT